jgi:hypothetical protein
VSRAKGQHPDYIEESVVILHACGLPERLWYWQGDDMTDRFLRIMTNLAVSHSLGNETSAQRPSQLSYLALDAYVRLIVLLVNCKPLSAPKSIPLLPSDQERYGHTSCTEHLWRWLIAAHIITKLGGGMVGRRLEIKIRFGLI